MIEWPSPATSHEWLKILASLVGGLILGLLLEPLKAAFQWQVGLRRLERATGLDTIYLLGGWTAVKVELVPSENFWNAMSMPGFDYYWSKNRELFFGDMDLHLVGVQCLTVNRLKEGVMEGEITKEAAGEKVEKLIAEMQAGALKRMSIKRRLMRRFRF